MTRRLKAWTAAVTAAAAITSAVHAGSYSFTKISGDEDYLLLNSFGVSTSASGQVAFHGATTPNNFTIDRGDGGAPSPLYDSTGDFSFVGPPGLNDNGAAAFVALQSGGGYRIVAGNGGAVTTIADQLRGPFSLLAGIPAINNAGDVAFWGRLDAGPIGIFRGNGGPATTIADDTGDLTMNTDPEDPRPDLNSAGRACFFSYYDAGGSGVFSGDGGPLTVIADTGSFDLMSNTCSINDAGLVAFGAATGPNANGVFTGDGMTTTPIADSSGAYQQFFEVALNNAGEVAFGAELDSGEYGIFTGPDSILDRVIATGDPLDDAHANLIIFRHQGLPGRSPSMRRWRMAARASIALTWCQSRPLRCCLPSPWLAGAARRAAHR